MKLRSKTTLAAAAIVLIVVVAAVAFTEYQDYNSPVAKCARDAAAGDSGVGQILVFPSITVEPGTTSGTLTVKIDGSACAPISNFAITSFHPFVNGVVNTWFIKYQGVVVSPTYPEPINQPAAGSILLSNVSVGQSYTFGYVITTGTNNPEFASSSGNVTFTAQP